MPSGLIKILDFSNKLQICNTYLHTYSSLSLFFIIFNLIYASIYSWIWLFFLLISYNILHLCKKCYKGFIEVSITIFRCATSRVWAKKISTKGHFEVQQFPLKKFREYWFSLSINYYSPLPEKKMFFFSQKACLRDPNGFKSKICHKYQRGGLTAPLSDYPTKFKFAFLSLFYLQWNLLVACLNFWRIVNNLKLINFFRKWKVNAPSPVMSISLPI